MVCGLVGVFFGVARLIWASDVGAVVSAGLLSASVSAVVSIAWGWSVAG